MAAVCLNMFEEMHTALLLSYLKEHGLVVVPIKCELKSKEIHV